MTFAERRAIQETARLCAELAERVAALEEAAKPKPRGRPRKPLDSIQELSVVSAPS